MAKKPKWQAAEPTQDDLDNDPEFAAFWKDLDESQREFLLRMSGPVTACHGTLRHKFPGIIPGKELSDHVVISLDGNGYLILEYCEEDCGRFIYYNAGRNGRPDRSNKRYGGWAVGEELAAGLGIKAWQYRMWMEHCSSQGVLDGYALQEKQRKDAEREAARKVG